MADNSPKGTLVAGPGVVVPADKDGDDCKAWRQAVARWCKQTREHKKKVKEWKAKAPPKGDRPTMPRRKFNDVFFEELNTVNPGLCASTVREFPLGAMVGGVSRSMEQIAAGGGAAASAAGAIGSAWTFLGAGLPVAGGAAGAWDGVRHALNQEAGQLAGARPFYPDGMRGGTALEIKGPGDREGDGQYQKYADASADKKCVTIDPKSCDPNSSELTEGGSCTADGPGA